MSSRHVLAMLVTAACSWHSPAPACAQQSSDSTPAQQRLPDKDELPPEAARRLGTLRLRSADAFASVTFTPDGRQLVTGGWGGARVYDVASGRLLRRIGQELENPTQPAALSPDGKLVAVGGWGERMGGAVYELATGKQRYRFGAPSTNVRGRFSPDGKVLAFFPRNDAAIVLLDAVTGKRLSSVKHHNWGNGFGINDLDVHFTSDSTTLISASGDGIRVTGINSGEQRRHIVPPGDGVAELAVSPDGALAAVVLWKVIAQGKQRTLTRRTEIGVWSLATGEQLRSIPAPALRKQYGHDNGPSFVMFSPDGKELVSGAPDGALRVFDVGTGKELRRFDHDSGLLGAAFGSDNTIALIEYCSLRLRDFKTGRDLFPTVGHREAVYAVLSPDGLTAATFSRGEHSARLWDTRTGQERRRLAGADEAFHSVRFSSDGKRVLASDYDGVLWIWDAATGKELKRIKHPTPVRAIALSADGSMLATDGFKEVLLLDAATGKELRKVVGAGEYIWGLDFTPDGRALLAWSNGKLHRWDIAENRHHVREFYKLETSPFDVQFSPDGRLVAFGVQNSDFLPVVDLATEREVCRFDLVPQEPAQNLAWVAFSPDSRTLAWGGRNEGSLWLGELASGMVRQRLRAHQGRVQSLCWSQDGRKLLTGSADTTAILWDLSGPVNAAPGTEVVFPEAEFEQCWADLRGSDAKKAYAAVRRLAAAPDGAAWLGRRLRPVQAADERRVTILIKDLESTNFSTREQAARNLREMGELSLPGLRQALKGQPPLEARRRLERLIEQLDAPTAERLQAIRGIEALEHSHSPEARALLQTLAKGAAAATLTREALAALARWRLRTPG
jgi:WD40 repeat protein